MTCACDPSSATTAIPTVTRGEENEPWNTAHIARLNPLVEVQVNEQWRVFGGPLFEAAIENGADLDDSFKPGGLLGAEVQVSSELSVGIGILGVAEIEEGFYLQPLLLLDWKASDRIAVHAESWSTRGGQIEVAYRANDWIELATSLEYRRERFRLKERSFGPGSEGIGEDRAVIPAVRISYLPDATIVRDTLGAVRIDLDVGVALAGRLRLENRKGSRIESMDYDPAPILGVTFRIPL